MSFKGFDKKGGTMFFNFVQSRTKPEILTIFEKKKILMLNIKNFKILKSEKFSQNSGFFKATQLKNKKYATCTSNSQVSLFSQHFEEEDKLDLKPSHSMICPGILVNNHISGTEDSKYLIISFASLDPRNIRPVIVRVKITYVGERGRERVKETQVVEVVNIRDFSMGGYKIEKGFFCVRFLGSVEGKSYFVILNKDKNIDCGMKFGLLTIMQKKGWFNEFIGCVDVRDERRFNMKCDIFNFFNCCQEVDGGLVLWDFRGDNFNKKSFCFLGLK